MFKLLSLLLSLSLALASPSCDAACRYKEARFSLVEAEETLSFDHGVPLTEQEKLGNQITEALLLTCTVDSMLSKLRQYEIAQFNSESEFLTATNFRSIRPLVSKLPVLMIFAERLQKKRRAFLS